MEADVMLPLSVPPAEIEKALLNIWESMKTPTKMRSSLFNLVIFTRRAERIDYFKQITEKLLNSFPCRVIFIVADPQKPEGALETLVSVISPPISHGFVICDLIEIRAAPSALSKTTSIAISHLLPDLPVYFLWADDPLLQDTVCSALERVASRVIMDSESCADIVSFAKVVLNQQKKNSYEIADLNWARMESWRDMITGAFARQDKRSMLSTLTSVVISYNTEPSLYFKKVKVQALFLQGWLASRLGWKLDAFEEKKEGLSFHYSTGSQKIHVLLAAEKVPKLWAGTILGVEFHTTDGRHYLFKRNIDRPQEAAMYYSSKEECYLPSHFLFTKTDSGQSLVKEICHSETSKHYLQMLEFLVLNHSQLPST